MTDNIRFYKCVLQRGRPTLSALESGSRKLRAGRVSTMSIKK